MEPVLLSLSICTWLSTGRSGCLVCWVQVDAVPEPAPIAPKGKGKNKRMNILDFITSDDPEPAPRPPPHASNARLHMNGPHPRGPVPVVQRPAQEEFPVRPPRKSRESTSAFQRLGPLSEFMKPLRSFSLFCFIVSIFVRSTNEG
jgi:hypothetical protein